MKLAIIGITGLVGQTILKVLEKFSFSDCEIIPVASAKSVNNEVFYQGKRYTVVDIEHAIDMKPDIAIFSAGKTVSLNYAESFVEVGSYVIDNSSAWRMKDYIQLIVPEVNISKLSEQDKIISNPNCSTIQLCVVLYPLHLKYGLKRVIVSTYQSVSGSGKDGIDQLFAERKDKKPLKSTYPSQIDLNCLPIGGSFLENDYSEEEWKLVMETKKIMGLDNLKITSTVVRVPVTGGHSESVNVEFENTPDLQEVREILSSSDGIKVLDDPRNSIYPTPLLCYDNDDVFVGRIRKDSSCNNGINLWCCSDNLRKGAATNAVQIAEYIFNNFIAEKKE